MTNDYSTEAQAVADAIDAVYLKKSSTTGLMKNDGSVDTNTYLTSHQDITGKADKTGGVAQVTDANANQYTNIGSLSSGATQQAINSAINTKLGDILGIEVIKVVTDKGTASASTMNKLFIEVGSNATDIYYTVEDDGSYSWSKLEEDILEDVSIDWSDVQNKPSFLAQSDINNSVGDFASALASAINPSS